MAGTFGYELDPGKLGKEEKEEIRRQIQDYHKYARLIQNGDYFRLTSPFEDELGAWEFVSESQDEVLFNVVMLEMHGNMTVSYVRLQGLDAEAMYLDKESGKSYSGAALMDAGIPVLANLGEYQAMQVYLVKDEHF